MRHKKLKIFGATLLVLLVGGVGACSYAMNKPSIVIGGIQKALYGDVNPNSWEPTSPTVSEYTADSLYFVSNLKYGTEYPNSFLDITYCAYNDSSETHPTLVYCHGGGYFAGSKSSGDPLAANKDSNYLFTSMVKEGFNLVNVDYALVNEYHFPVPVLQMNEAINYLVENADSLRLNMHDVVIMGGSAGAIMTAQYGTILSNPDYCKLYHFKQQPKLKASDVKALVVDDAPIDIPSFDNKNIKIIIANYLDDDLDFSNEALARQYNALNYIDSRNYPPTFMTAGTDDGFPKDMKHLQEILTNLGVSNCNFETPENKYGKTKHGYLSDLAKGKQDAIDCYASMMAFLREHVPGLYPIKK